MTRTVLQDSERDRYKAALEKVIEITMDTFNERTAEEQVERIQMVAYEARWMHDKAWT
jgi:urate oxidase